MFMFLRIVVILAVLFGYGFLAQKYQYQKDLQRIELYVLSDWVHKNKLNAHTLLSYKRECSGTSLEAKQKKIQGYTKYKCAQEYGSKELRLVLESVQELLEYKPLSMYFDVFFDKQSQKQLKEVPFLEGLL